MKRTFPRALVVVAALGLGGCGVGTGAPDTAVSLLVTRDFGGTPVDDQASPKTQANDTVLRILERNEKTTSAGGRIATVDGPPPTTWKAFVNGVALTGRAATTKLRESDRVWWDGSTPNAVQAVVGSFPEPFLHGYDGKRLPTRLECTEPGSAQCDAAGKSLGAVGVVAGRGGLQTSLSRETTRVLVGVYAALRNDDTVRNLENGPAKSGVYARPAANGRSIQVLDANGRVARTLGPGSGLIAVTRFEGGRPVWIVTGTDAAGTAAAAKALEEGDLRGHFALAVVNGEAVDVPLVRQSVGG